MDYQRFDAPAEHDSLEIDIVGHQKILEDQIVLYYRMMSNEYEVFR